MEKLNLYRSEIIQCLQKMGIEEELEFNETPDSDDLYQYLRTDVLKSTSGDGTFYKIDEKGCFTKGQKINEKLIKNFLQIEFK